MGSPHLPVAMYTRASSAASAPARLALVAYLIAFLLQGAERIELFTGLAMQGGCS